MTAVKTMLHHTAGIAAALMLGAMFAGPAAAQAASTDKPAPMPTPAPAAQGKSDGTTQGKSDGATQRTDTTTYGGWTVTCRQVVDSKAGPQCAAQLRVVEPNTKTIVVFWQIANSGKDALSSVIQTPTGVQIKPGIELAVGKAAPVKIDFDTCSPRNCEAVSQISAAMADQIRKAIDVTFTVTAKDGRQIHFKAPLDGSMKALDTLVAKTKG